MKQKRYVPKVAPPKFEDMVPAQKARVIISEVTREMVAKGYPVELTHKAGFRPDYIPADTFAWPSDPELFEDTLALALVEGWSSKRGLIELLKVVRRVTAQFAPARTLICESAA